MDLLVWLADQARSVDNLRTELGQKRYEGEREQLERWVDAVVTATPNEAGGLQINADPEFDQDEADREGFMRVWEHLEPPVELRERLRLYASTRVHDAFREFRATRSMPELVASDVSVWSETLESAARADAAFRDVIVEEIANLTSENQRRIDE